MTKFLGILLALLIGGLCTVCVMQWVRETALKQTLADVDARLKEEQESKVKLEEKLKAWEKEIKHLNTRIEEQGAKIAEQEKAAMALNEQLTVEKTRADELAKKLNVSSTSAEKGKEALEAHNAAVAEQNATIAKQNQMLKDLAAERDTAILKFNVQMKEYNELVAKYNALAKPPQ